MAWVTRLFYKVLKDLIYRSFHYFYLFQEDGGGMEKVCVGPDFKKQSGCAERQQLYGYELAVSCHEDMGKNGGRCGLSSLS